eukprot:TRINITY_DN2522_c0_g2_i5.p1 TRINITY_DN2522_c0_g2~~TRINITY_DN2522_c0_g2_i5.p1  ORF type:complete len:786 (+),score=102.74 TRINITY_DN2522_c0_g2_i5:78-2435(+)
MLSFIIFLMLPSASAAPGYVGPFTSFTGTTKCSTINASSGGAASPAAHKNYALDYTCDSLEMPSAWQKANDAGPTQYDLAIVGGGIGGAYLVSRLHEEFAIRRNQPMPKIALFERTDTIGGRLLTSFGAGGLNLGMNSKTRKHRERPRPMPEYGGMRIDPKLYPLVYNRIVYAARSVFGADACEPNCTLDGTVNCCPEMLSRMEVGAIRYVTTKPNAAPFMRSSTVTTKSQTYNGKRAYKLSDIAQGIGSPFDQCLQLVVAADAYYLTGEEGVGIHPIPADGLWKTAINKLCTDCATSGIEGMCRLCNRFNGTEAAAVLSCSGYDSDLASASLHFVVGLTSEVCNIRLKTNLYLVNMGFQWLAMSLLNGPQWSADATNEVVHLFKNKASAVAPQYGKQLSTVSALSTTNHTTSPTAELVARQIDGTSSAVAGGVNLYFADGSSATAKTAYLSMLPYDLAALDGFREWAPALERVLPDVYGAVKIVFGWTNASEALGARLGLSSCVEGYCERLILDGPADTWLMRQIWLWDAHTIMLYGIAPHGTPFPSNRIAAMAREQGMDAMVEECIAQLRTAVGLPDLKDPDWARLKTWPHGSLVPGWKVGVAQADIDAFVDAISRPLGKGVPLFYGNSEMAKNGNNHGWVEGAFEMVEAALPELTRQLGLDPPFATYDPKDLSHVPYASPPSSSTPPGASTSIGVGTLVAAVVGSVFVGVVLGIGIHMTFLAFRQSQKRQLSVSSTADSSQLSSTPASIGANMAETGTSSAAQSVETTSATAPEPPAPIMSV